MEKLQTENGVLRNEVEKFKDRERAWAPLVQAGLARGRKQANVATPATPTSAKGLDSAEPPAVPSPQPRSKLIEVHINVNNICNGIKENLNIESTLYITEKTIFARLKDSFSDKAVKREQSPNRGKGPGGEEKTSGVLRAGEHPTSADTAVASPGAVGRRRGTRRSAADADLDNVVVSAVKKRNITTDRRDNANANTDKESGSEPTSKASATSQNTQQQQTTIAKGELHSTAHQIILLTIFFQQFQIDH